MTRTKAHFDLECSDPTRCTTIELNYFAANNFHFELTSRSLAQTLVRQRYSHNYFRFPHLSGHCTRRIPSGEWRYIFCHWHFVKVLTMNLHQGDLAHSASSKAPSRLNNLLQLGSLPSRKLECHSPSTQTELSAVTALELSQLEPRGSEKCIAL